MRYRCAALVLLPLLVAQGRRVRRVTPRLPEAPGPREGVAGRGPRLRLLVTGDSAAAGVGASSQDEALVGQIVSRLSARCTVEWRLVAATGATTRDACRTLAALPPTACDVAVVSLGVNDVTGGRLRAAWLRDVGALVDTLRVRHGARLVLLSGLPPIHAFPALPLPLRWYLGGVARQFDRGLAAWASRREGCAHVVVAFPLEAAAMASDGFHPGPPVYRAWGEAVARAVQRARLIGD